MTMLEVRYHPRDPREGTHLNHRSPNKKEGEKGKKERKKRRGKDIYVWNLFPTKLTQTAD